MWGTSTATNEQTRLVVVLLFGVFVVTTNLCATAFVVCVRSCSSFVCVASLLLREQNCAVDGVVHVMVLVLLMLLCLLLCVWVRACVRRCCVVGCAVDAQPTNQPTTQNSSDNFPCIVPVRRLLFSCVRSSPSNTLTNTPSKMAEYDMGLYGCLLYTSPSPRDRG